MMETATIPEKQVVLGGYPAKTCFTVTAKNWDGNYPDDLKVPVSPFQQNLFDNGNRFEDEIGEQLAGHYNNVAVDCAADTDEQRLNADIQQAREHELVRLQGDREPASLAGREHATHQLLNNPGNTRIIWNARIRAWRSNDGVVEWSHRISEPDFLVWAGQNVDGTHLWCPGDVKWHQTFKGTTKPREWQVSSLADCHPDSGYTIQRQGTPQLGDAMQLAHYWASLNWHGHAGPRTGLVVGKPDSEHGQLAVRVDLDAQLYSRGKESADGIYQRKFAKVTAVAEHAQQRSSNPDMGIHPDAEPAWKTECDQCVWRNNCHDELVAADHITLLPGVTPTRAEKIAVTGADTIKKLAQLDDTTAQLLDAGTAELAEMIEAAQNGQWDDTTAVAVAVVDTLHGTNSDGKARRARPKTVNDTISHLAAAGVDTAAKLAELDHRTALHGGKLQTHIDQARVVDVAVGRRSPHVFRRRGVDALNIPRANVEIHVDMENDEHIYLWGAYRVERNGRSVNTSYHPFVSWTGDDDGEANCFDAFWRWLAVERDSAKRIHGPDGFKAYCFTEAENRCMLALARKHVRRERVPGIDTVNELLGSDDWVDLHRLLTEQLVWPVENHKLKTLAKYARFMWRDDDPSGAASIVWYKHATDPDEKDREGWRNRILDYNEDDVRATAHLLEWAGRFNSVWTPKGKLQNVEKLTSKYRARR